MPVFTVRNKSPLFFPVVLYPSFCMQSQFSDALLFIHETDQLSEPIDI